MFGIYSALGVLSTLALLFLFLPSWMQLWPMRPHSLLDGEQPKSEDIDLPIRWRRVLQTALDRHRLVFAGLVTVMVVCGIGLLRTTTSIKLTKLFSPSAQIIHDYSWLEENLGPLVPMEVIVKIDTSKNHMTMLEKMELIERIQSKMQGIEHMGSTMSAATFAPELPKGRRGVLSRNMNRSVTNKRLEANREEYLESDFLDIDGSTELWRISARVGALNDVDYGEFKNNIRAEVEPVIVAERRRLEKEEATARRDGTTEVKTAAVAGPGGDDRGISTVYTGLVPVVYKAQREMLNGLAWNFVTDLVTIGTVMTLVFWDLSAGLILLIPSTFPIMVVFGLMGWMGVVVDVGTIMTPVTALGVSVDDVVHFLIWYRRGLKEGRQRKGSIMLAYEGCARAMYQSWSVLGLGLAVFALSAFVPTQRFGAMMFLLLSAALVGNLFMLPAVLASPIAYFFGRRLRRQAERQKPSVPEPATTAAGPPEALTRHLRRDTPHDARK
jgi:predicted RND superfamily exporter protein